MLCRGYRLVLKKKKKIYQVNKQNYLLISLLKLDSTHLPFLKSLEAFRVEFLDCNHGTSAAVTPGAFLFKPAFEDFPKPSLSENILRLEVPR